MPIRLPVFLASLGRSGRIGEPPRKGNLLADREETTFEEASFGLCSLYKFEEADHHHHLQWSFNEANIISMIRWLLHSFMIPLSRLAAHVYSNVNLFFSDYRRRSAAAQRNSAARHCTDCSQIIWSSSGQIITADTDSQVTLLFKFIEIYHPRVQIWLQFWFLQIIGGIAAALIIDWCRNAAMAIFYHPRSSGDAVYCSLNHYFTF